MTALKLSFVLDANKEVCLINWLCNKLWYNNEAVESIDKTINRYVFQELGLINDMTYDEVKQFYHNYMIKVSDYKEFIKMLEEHRKTFCDDDRLKKNYIKRFDDTFTTYQDIFQVYIKEVYKPYINR